MFYFFHHFELPMIESQLPEILIDPALIPHPMDMNQRAEINTDTGWNFVFQARAISPCIVVQLCSSKRKVYFSLKFIDWSIRIALGKKFRHDLTQSRSKGDATEWVEKEIDWIWSVRDELCQKNSSVEEMNADGILVWMRIMDEKRRCLIVKID
jgi:hypothetical protein